MNLLAKDILLMSALGHKRTSAVQNGMSAWPPKADICASRFLEKSHGFAPATHLKALLHAPASNIDDMHRSVALATDGQLFAAERKIHRLASDLHGELIAE